ncbi:hypothetical protein, partial [Streptomyces hygroscopicus]|uniref:hypothetical protein n=1 Tax=Streptomyces hygroscopicus TaxID=1912 RepID=UPI0036C8B088
MRVGLVQPVGLDGRGSRQLGRARTRTAVAWWTALAMAAAVPTMPTSPRPLAPMGLVCGSGSSSQWAST